MTENYTRTISALISALSVLSDCEFERRVLDVLPALIEQRARHWTKGAHGYFTGSWSDGNNGGSGGKGLDKSGGSGIIDINIDEFVPCLKDARTGEILETEISEMRRSDLRKYTEKNGWNDDWAKRPHGEHIFGVFLKGDTEPQGLISLRYERGGTYLASASTAPHNNKLIVGDNQKYIGVGGHLFALGVQKSLENGGHGTVYGFAVNRDVLEHYINKFGAVHIPMVHPFQFVIEGEASKNLLDTYNYTER